MLLNSSYVNSNAEGNSVYITIQAFIGLIGITCNILSILVFERKPLKKHSYAIYWKWIAVFDSLLLLHTFRNWLRHFLNMDIDLISPLFCRLVEYHGYVSGGISLIIESFITFDRYFAIVHHKRYGIIKQRRFQIAAISFAVIFSLLHCIRMPLNYRLERVNETLICHIPLNVLNLNLFLGAINVFVVNLIINPILDFKIISYVFSTRGGSFMTMRRKFATSAICLNINSLLYKLLFIIGNFLSKCYFDIGSYQSDFVYSICLSVALLEKSDVFLINVLVNSAFRQEFLSMIGVRNSNNNNNMINMSAIQPRTLALQTVELLSNRTSCVNRWKERFRRTRTMSNSEL
jgi:hypothetical protein